MSLLTRAVELKRNNDDYMWAVDRVLDRHGLDQSGVEELGTPLILCRYESGILVNEQVQLDKIDYVAVSHVWGTTQWLRVPGIDREILVSKEKANFIAH